MPGFGLPPLQGKVEAVVSGFKVPSTRDIVLTTMRNHPKDCIFAPNAVDNICAALAHAKNEEDFLEICVRALRENEIYCPHEGIDRRKEFGLL